MVFCHMSQLPLWFILVGCICGAQPNLSSYTPHLTDNVEDIRPVGQEEAAIQRMKVTLNNDRISAAILPLTIESYSKLNSGSEEENSREFVNKRQASTSIPNESVKKASRNDNKNARITTPVPSKRREQPTEATKHEVKSNVRFEPKTNQYGIGSTLVLTSTTIEDEPRYVDQTQPHTLAKPLKYETQSSDRADINIKRVETPSKQSYHVAEPPKEESYREAVPLKKGYIEDSRVGQDSVESETYGRYSQGGTPTQVQNPVYQETNLQQNREVHQSPARQPVYSQYQPATEEQPRKIYQSQYNEPTYPSNHREVIPAAARPSAPRPAYEGTQPEYIDLRPAHEKQPPKNDNRKPASTDDEYLGFPESFHPSKDPALSRPLQYEPPRVFPPSPCNMIFKYEGREPNEDFWFGDIYISTDEVLVGMRLDITLDRPARLLSNWMSEVKSKDNIHFTVLSLRKKLVPGPAETVRIQVRFHSDKPVPFIQSINLNGRRICPSKGGSPYQKPTSRPNFENPGDIPTKETTESYARPPVTYEEVLPATTQRVIRQPERRPTTEIYQPPRTSASYPEHVPGPNPNHVQGSFANGNRVPTERPHKKPSITVASHQVIECGKPAVQPRPLVTYGQNTARGQWPWHAAIYRNIGVDLSYICGGSLISAKHVVTAAHCVTNNYDNRAFDGSSIVVYLGKYHLKMWSDGGVQNKQVSSVEVHPEYNSTDFRADLAVLVLSSPVEFTDFIRPVCLWDRNRTDISEVEGVEGTVLGWGYDEEKKLTEQLMQAKMPVIKHDVCLWSYPEFFPHFTSNLTYCAGFRNGTSVCNGDSGGGMVFPLKKNEEERWYLRGLVSISVGKQTKVCDTSHYVVFTDVAKFLNFLYKFL